MCSLAYNSRLQSITGKKSRRQELEESCHIYGQEQRENEFIHACQCPAISLFYTVYSTDHKMVSHTSKVGFPFQSISLRKPLTVIPEDQHKPDNSSLTLPRSF